MQKPNDESQKNGTQLTGESAFARGALGSEQTEVETDREFKAHIYQQLIDLQPYLTGTSQVAVIVQLANSEGDVLEMAPAAQSPEEDSEYLVTLSASLGDARVESHGQDGDLYSAFGKAKAAMVSHLAEWTESEQDARERETQIRAFADAGSAGARLLH